MLKIVFCIMIFLAAAYKLVNFLLKSSVESFTEYEDLFEYDFDENYEIWSNLDCEGQCSEQCNYSCKGCHYYNRNFNGED